MARVLERLIFICGGCLAHGANSDSKVCDLTKGFYNTSSFNADWDDLSATQRHVAGRCGWSRRSWNGPSACFHCFDDLETDERQAVLDLGSDAQCWNRGMTSWGVATCKTASSQEMKSRPSGVKCNVSTATLTGPSDTSSKPWKALSDKQRQAAITCGFDQDAWDGPSECRSCFADLSESQKQTVLAMDTDSDCWDSAFQSIYTVDCSKLVKETKETDRRALYDGLGMKFQVYSKKLVSKGFVGFWARLSGRPFALNLVMLLMLSISVSTFALVHLRHNWRPEKQPEPRQREEALPDRRAALLTTVSSHEYLPVPCDESA
eukprot:gnl/TRDRNA2_/TRDRNA2_175056_c0_seq1.p1 gnl/TRDRNA2_/TRDRNA2_175056_c0~~gnl/TRDRNA2_/TRDRNA2_175056_c0_seq1.p1  ORF type:complete len:320 (+),score=31.53 gnl/TRDRNA2_/TRDRNA2_175056_c0_seq1:55-1014(+)